MSVQSASGQAGDEIIYMRVPLAGGRHRRDASVPDEGDRAAWVVALSDEASVTVMPSYRHGILCPEAA